MALCALLLGGAPRRGWGDDAGTSGPPIAVIIMTCAAPIDRQGLTALLPFHVGERWTAADVEAAAARLRATELFNAVDVRGVPRGNGVAVIIALDRKPIIDAVRFRGNHSLGDEELRRRARLQLGAAFTPAQLDAAARRIRERYAADGFEAARSTALVHPVVPGEVDVEFQIDEGPPTVIASISIGGGSPLAPSAIRQVLKLHVGERYTREKRRAAQTAITRLFRDRRYYEVEVRADWEMTGPHAGALRFTVEPGPLFEIRFSGNHHFNDAHLLGLMDLPTRPIVTDGTWRELARRAQRAYQQDGYYMARVDVRIEQGSLKRVDFTVREGRTYRVGGVEFDGVHGLSPALLRARMATRPPSWIPWRRGIFLDDVFADDLKRLWYVYRQHGFESAEIVDARTRLDDAHGKIFATVTVEEGRQTVVERVEESGLAPLGAHLPELQTRVGRPFDPEAVEADRRNLVLALAKVGYGSAEVTSRVTTHPSEATDAAVVHFEAAPGEQRRVGAIIVQNNFETRARVVLRELPFKSGDPLNPDALLRGQSNVYALGLFRSVTVRPLPPQDARRDVAVNVAEKLPGSLQWGVGYNTRDGFRTFLEVADNNLGGAARRLSLRGDLSVDPGTLSPNQYLADLGYREPQVGNTHVLFRTDLIAQRSTRLIDPFSLERFALVPAVERTLAPGLRAGFEVQLEQSQLFDVKPDVLAFNPRDTGRLQTVSTGPFVIYDGRDDLFAPRRGVFDSVRLKYAPAELGSDVPFIKLIWQHSQYVPVADGWTFVYAVRGGWAHAFETGAQVPIRERFFLGGRTTVRGFGENVIGPLGAATVDRSGRVVQPGGDPLGGDLAVNLNTELRFPLLDGLGGAVFVDGGGVYLQDRPITLPDFRRSAGLGLRYLTPIGPISLDYGFKLDRRPGESIGEVHFSIGTIF